MQLPQKQGCREEEEEVVVNLLTRLGSKRSEEEREEDLMSFFRIRGRSIQTILRHRKLQRQPHVNSVTGGFAFVYSTCVELS